MTATSAIPANDQFQTVSMTVGKLDASLALLTTDEHHIVEFPTILLPKNIDTGSVIEFKVRNDKAKEKENELDFFELQNEIFAKYGKDNAQAPVLSTMNITQTSCVLQWDQLELGSTQLKSLSLWKFVPTIVPTKATSASTRSRFNTHHSQGGNAETNEANEKEEGMMERITIIPNPITTHNFKISGLGVNSKYKFQLKLETSNGEFFSNVLTVHTHTMTDMSGITCCLGSLDYEKYKISAQDIEACLQTIGAKLPLQKHVSVDTTHYITNESEIENEDKDEELTKAKKFNIPIVKPEWVRACQLEQKIMGVKGFYYKNSEKDDLSGNYKFDKNYTKAYLDKENRKSMSSVSKKSLSELYPQESATAEKDKVDNKGAGENNASEVVDVIGASQAEQKTDTQLVEEQSDENPEITNDKAEKAQTAIPQIHIAPPADLETAQPDAQGLANNNSSPVQKEADDQSNPEEEPREPKDDGPKNKEQKPEELTTENFVPDDLPTEEPATEELATEEPATEEPATEEPATEEPATEEPATEEPATEEPATEEPATEEPATEEPATEEPATEEPATEEPATEEPATEEPATEEPATEEPATEEPATEEPASAEPTTEEPRTEDPATVETTTEEPASAEPATKNEQ
ncbi:hypothetical protein ACO0QE_004540 [Hanseniaspora vineae]